MACICQDALGEVKAVSAQEVCQAGSMEQAAKKWRTRLDALLGQCTAWDELKTEKAFSAIGAYGNGAAVRLFLDEGAEDVAENFEIVTQKALLVWKPEAHPQGRMLAQQASFCSCAQPYSVNLEEKPL